MTRRAGEYVASWKHGTWHRHHGGVTGPHDRAVTVAPYGSWASTFPIERLTDRVVFLSERTRLDGVR